MIQKLFRQASAVASRSIPDLEPRRRGFGSSYLDKGERIVI
jgi:hypothetical protein